MDHLRGYENAGHVLRVLAEMHEEIAQVLNELGGQARDDRRKLNLAYLADHHSKRASALSAYHRDADATLLQQWFQIPFPEDPRELIESLRALAPEHASLERLMSDIDTFIDRLLSHLRDRSETSNVKALFQDLLDIETRERLMRSRALASFAQI
jgi:hypothetical protein